MNTAEGSEKRILSYPFAPSAQPRLAAALAEGKMLSYPTETSYALGGNALYPALAAEVFHLKGRSQDKAFLLLIDGEAQARRLTAQIDPAAEALMRSCWPGPLTLVLPAAADLTPHLRVVPERGGQATIALRHCPHPAVAELLRLGGVPLIGTSANLSGQPPARTAAEVCAFFGAALDTVVDGGATPAGAPSTLLDTTCRPFRILRQGALPARTLAELLKAEFPQAAPA